MDWNLGNSPGKTLVCRMGQRLYFSIIEFVSQQSSNDSFLQGGLGLGLHFDGFPEADWTEAFGVFANEQPVWFGAILAFIAIAEGESVGHSGDNFRGMSTKTSKAAGDLNFDYLGIKKKASAEKLKRYDDVETKNGRAAMIAMASMWAYEAIPGSVPIMDLLN
jgi:hypothetical protein